MGAKTVTAIELRPYYRGPFATLFRGDCRDVLPLLRDRADLIVTDPPYGMNYDSGFRSSQDFGKIAGDDGSLDIAECIRAALKLLRPNRHIYCFGPNVLDRCDVSDPVNLIWDKRQVGSGDLNVPWGPSWEPIWFGVYETSPKERINGTGSLTARLRKEAVLRYRKKIGQQVNRHPTEKPVDLLRELIESSSRLGELVLDPFAGSGSTLVAATIEGRRSIGVELEERYCKVAAERLQTAEAMYGRLVAA